MHYAALLGAVPNDIDGEAVCGRIMKGGFLADLGWPTGGFLPVRRPVFVEME